MKRDMELVRELLLYFEEKPDPKVIMPADVVIPGREPSEVHYHILIMCEAGLLTCERVESSTTPSRLVDALPFGLSWPGMSSSTLLAAIRSGSRPKRRLGAEGLGLGFGLLQALSQHGEAAVAHLVSGRPT